jgi:serine/threonine protein kinase
MVMTFIIDPKWSFEEALARISHRYPPGGLRSGPQRNSTIEAWANLVGRDRASRELENTLRKFGSLAAAGKAFRMTPATIERFRKSFAAMPRHRVRRPQPNNLLRISGLKVEQKPFAEGASSLIYKAVAKKGNQYIPSGTKLAIKTIKAEMLNKANEPARIRREFEIGSSIEHPNLIRVFQLISDLDKHFPFVLVMEYIDGEPLSSLLSAGKINERTKIALELANAVDALHAKDILHRDIKTDNILVAVSGSVTLIDYGVSKMADHSPLTALHEFLGTKRYASPQAIEGQKPTKADDIYSLGAVFYELFVGKVLFDGIDNHAQLIDAVRNQSPDVFSVSTSLEEFTYRIRLLIHRMLDKAPKSRPDIATVRSWIEDPGSPDYVQYLEEHHRRNIKDEFAKIGNLPTSFFAQCEICNAGYVLGKRDLNELGIDTAQMARSLQRMGRVRIVLQCGQCAKPFSMSQMTGQRQKYIVVEMT